VVLLLLDPLRVGVQILGHLAQHLRGQLMRVLDDFGILLVLRPVGGGTVTLGQLAQLAKLLRKLLLSEPCRSLDPATDEPARPRATRRRRRT